MKALGFNFLKAHPYQAIGFKYQPAPLQQGKMLDGLEDDVEGVQSRLQAAHRKMQQVLKKAGSKGQIAIIAILTVLLIILFLVVGRCKLDPSLKAAAFNP